MRNNPVNLTDPSGLCGGDEDDSDCGPVEFCIGNCSDGGAAPPDIPGPPPAVPPVPVVNDPFTVGCEHLGMPCGMQLPVAGGDCTFVSNDCGGIADGFSVGSVGLYRPPFLNNIEFLYWILQSARSNMSAGKQLIQQQTQARIGCESDAARTRQRADETVSQGADAIDSQHNPMQGGPVDYEPDPGSDYTIDPNTNSGAWALIFGDAAAYLQYRSKMGACAAQNTLAPLGR